MIFTEYKYFNNEPKFYLLECLCYMYLLILLIKMSINNLCMKPRNCFIPPSIT